MSRSIKVALQKQFRILLNLSGPHSNLTQTQLGTQRLIALAARLTSAPSIKRLLIEKPTLARSSHIPSFPLYQIDHLKTVDCVCSAVFMLSWLRVSDPHQIDSDPIRLSWKRPAHLGQVLGSVRFWGKDSHVKWP